MKINNKTEYVANVDIERIVDSLLFNYDKDKNCEIIVDCFTTEESLTLGIVLDTSEETCSLDICSDNFEVKSIQSDKNRSCSNLIVSGFLKWDIRNFFIDILIHYKSDEKYRAVRFLSKDEYDDLHRELSE